MRVLQRHRAWFVLVLAVVAAGARLAAQQPAPDIREVELDNGLKLVVLPIAGTDRVGCCMAYNIGSADERTGETGMARLLARLTNNGTDAIGSKDWEDEQPALERLDETSAALVAVRRDLQVLRDAGSAVPEKLAARQTDLEAEFRSRQQTCDESDNGARIGTWYRDIGASDIEWDVSPDVTMFKAVLPAAKVEMFFSIESQRMTRCVFRGFYRERAAFIRERDNAPDKAQNRLREQMYALAFEGTPYRNPDFGRPGDVDAITRTRMAEVYRTYYVPNNAALVVAGDITVDAALTLAKRWFGAVGRAPGIVAPPTRNAAPSVEKRLRLAEGAIGARICFPTLGRHHAGSLAFDVLAYHLNAEAGPLKRRLVAEEKLAVSASSAHWCGKHGGMLSIGAQGPADPDAIAERAIDTVKRVLDGDKEYALTPEIITAYAASVERDTAQALADVRVAAGTLARVVFTEGLADLRSRPERLRKLLPEDIIKIVRPYLAAENRVVACIAPVAASVPTPQRGAMAELERRIAAEMDDTKRKELERLLGKLREADKNGK